MNEQWLFLPTQLVHLMNKTITTYLQAPEEVQRLVNKTYAIQGRYGDKYVFQLSHGTQQIKRYEPHKYRNDRNSPLRQRVRDIMALAWQNPEPNITERLQELHRNYPYYLLRTEPVKLRMKNFYFDGPVRVGEVIRVYQAIDPENPNPELDILYVEENFAPKREIVFEYAGEDEQFYYGVKARNGDRSNILNFVWGDVLPEPQRRENATPCLPLVNNGDKNVELQEKNQATPCVSLVDNKAEQQQKKNVTDSVSLVNKGDKNVEQLEKNQATPLHLPNETKFMTALENRCRVNLCLLASKEDKNVELQEKNQATPCVPLASKGDKKRSHAERMNEKHNTELVLRNPGNFAEPDDNIETPIACLAVADRVGLIERIRLWCLLQSWSLDLFSRLPSRYSMFQVHTNLTHNIAVIN